MQLLCTLQQADVRLFAWLYQTGERYLLIAPARAISRSGDGYLHILIPLLMLCMGVDRVGDLILVIALALCIERPLYWLLKNSLKRRRPAQFSPDFHSIIVASDRFSFPSGHSSAAFLLVTSLCIIYGVAGAALLLWALAVGLSRILLGVHFPGDVAAGASIGAITAMTAGSLLMLV
jgi:undecaprenyl-diphosphatase